MTDERNCPSCGHGLTSDVAYCSRCGSFVGSPDTSPTPGAKKRRNAWEVILDRLRASLAPRYRVIRLLGYGGMAGVYLAEETRLGRKVAIKVISPALMVDPAQAERFEQEARTTAQLDHPNIVTVYEVDERDELHFFTMTYVQGRSLSQVMSEAEGPLELAVVRAWLGQIASALAYAHTRGVVHRDIKPGNVLLDDSGKALVGDFGIAKVQDQEGLTRTGMLVGTPNYMSPEQCTTGKVTGASDQYSLGAMAYQMITGSPPFSGPTMSVIQSHLNEPPKRISEIRPDCPEELEDAILRMLEKRPEDRFPVLEAALDALSGGPLRYDDPIREHMAALARWTDSISLEVEPSTITEMPVAPGERFTIRAVPRAADGSPLPDRRIEWSTSPGDVLEVAANGSVLALKRGRASIVASSASGVSEAVEVTVEIPAPEVVPEPEVGPGDEPESEWEMKLEGGVQDGSATRLVAPGDPLPPSDPTPDPERSEATPPPEPPRETPRETPAPIAVTPPKPPPSVPDRARPKGTTPKGPSPKRRPPSRAGAGRGNRGLAIGGAVAALALIGVIGWIISSGGGGGAATSAGIPTDSATGASEVTADADPGADPDAPTTVEVQPPPVTAEEEEEAPPQVTPPVTAPPETADPTPAEPEPGVLALGSDLPPGAQVTVTGNGVQRTLAGGSLSLPPGTYRLAGRADGYEPVSGSIEVGEGERATWAPRWVAVAPDPPPVAPDPEPQPAEPVGPTPEEDRAAIVEVVRAFASAVQARSPEGIRAVYPRITAPDLAQWEAFFNTPRLRDLQAEAAPRSPPTLDGDRAEVQFGLTLRYSLPGATPPSDPVVYEAVMVRSGDRWVIDQLRQSGS